KKVIVFKYKSKAHQRRKRGHRQNFTALRIDKISV
ncbi:MAG TPA: bL21 family ribosomal protein, partial [bacterium]|nr:bL21 family ribosomal protein [bacterium]